MVMNSDALEQWVLVYSTYNLILSWSSGAANVSERERQWYSLLQEWWVVSRMGQVFKKGCCHQSRDLWLLLSQAGYQNLSSVHAHAWSPTCTSSICCATHSYQPCQTRETSKGRNANAGLSASKSPLSNPTIVPVTPSGTMMEHQHLTADMFVITYKTA